jgi:hypothetical protein
MAIMGRAKRRNHRADDANQAEERDEHHKHEAQRASHRYGSAEHLFYKGFGTLGGNNGRG